MKRRKVLLLSFLMVGSMVSSMMVHAENGEQNVLPETVIQEKSESIGRQSEIPEEDIVKNDATGIPDKALYDALLQSSRDEDGILTREELRTVWSVYSNNAGISSLKGIELCENIQYIDLNSNSISDVSPLAGLKSLTSLSLDSNTISDVSPLAELKNLTYLSLGSNSISDVSSLAGLKNLTTLWLGYNNISNISALAGLVNLTGLAVNDNNISSLPDLRNLTALESVGLQCIFSGNKITLEEAKKNLPEQLMNDTEWVSWQGFLNGEGDEQGGTLSFIPISNIRIGEDLSGKFRYKNASQGMEPTIGFAKEDGDKFWLMGSGGPSPVFPSSGPIIGIYRQNVVGTGTTYCSEAIKVGTVQAKCYTTYKDCWENKEPIATYPVTIEEPVVTTNSNDSYYVGDEIEFNTKLTNVAVKEGNIEEMKVAANPNINGSFTYQAKTEVIEGENLIVSENADYSNALNSTEKLRFTGTGSVKIKITYSPVALWYGLTDADGRDLSKEIYMPEKIVTIQVMDAKKALNDEISNIISQNLEEAKYTAESWQVFCTALENAKTVADSDSATKEEYVTAYEALKAAKDGLKLKESKPSDPGDKPSQQPQNPNGNKPTIKADSEKKVEAPKTGDTASISILIFLAGMSLITVICCIRRKADR